MELSRQFNERTRRNQENLSRRRYLRQYLNWKTSKHIVGVIITTERRHDGKKWSSQKTLIEEPHKIRSP